MSTTPAPVDQLSVPDHIEFAAITGPVSGKQLFKVKGFEMPWQGSVASAYALYTRLLHAQESGYYRASAKPANERRPA